MPSDSPLAPPLSAARRSVAGQALQTLAHQPLLARRATPSVDLDPGRRRLVVLQDEVEGLLAEGRGATVLPRLRTEAYRLASCSWEDPWAYGLVAWCEEAVAENHRLQLHGERPPDPFGEIWRPVWVAWRTAWWIRRAQGAPAPLLAHGDRIMGILHARMERWNDARARLEEALGKGGEVQPVGLDPLGAAGAAEATRQLWHAVAMGDAF